MRIYSVQNVEFSGRLKHGDLLKKLNQLNEIAKIKAQKLCADTDNSLNASLYKIFDNPDNLTPKDNSKTLSTATSTVTVPVTSKALSITDNSGTWSIFSTLS